MPDYQKGKIYKLWSPSKNLVYYGSTTQTISQRLADHLKRKKNNNINVSVNLVLNCDDYKIELIEECPSNNLQQLRRKEGEYIKANKCVNIFVAGRTPKEWDEQNKEKRKGYEKKCYQTKKQNNAIYQWLLMTGITQ